MEIQQDFKELLVLLNDHKVEYMIVGGYALAFHGAPRYTGDLDIYVKPDQKNAQNLLAALDDFGFASVNLKQSDFQSPEMVIQLGVPLLCNYRCKLEQHRCHLHCYHAATHDYLSNPRQIHRSRAHIRGSKRLTTWDFSK
jgi:hypothetical protein